MPDGRKYYFNASTGESTWERPVDYQPVTVMPAASTTISASQKSGSNANVGASWREMTAQNGRKYYYNTVTKVSVWEMPPDFKGFIFTHCAILIYRIFGKTS